LSRKRESPLWRQYHLERCDVAADDEWPDGTRNNR
jgi:hypothetical protein